MKKLLLLINLVVIFFTILYCQSGSFTYEKFASAAVTTINDTCKGYVFRIVDEKTKQPLNSFYIQCNGDSALGSYIVDNGYSSCISGIDKTKQVNCDVTDLYRKYQDKRFLIPANSKDTLVLEVKKL